MSTIVTMLLALFNGIAAADYKVETVYLLNSSYESSTNYSSIEFTVQDQPKPTDPLMKFIKEGHNVVCIQWDGNVIYDTNKVSAASVAFWNAVTQVWPELKEIICKQKKD